MTVFKDKEQMMGMLTELWSYVIKETECGPKLKEYEINIKYIIKDPNGYLFVDHDEVITGDEANKDAVITMELSSETVHQFWLKKIKLPVALATRKIKSKGPIPKVLKILPYLKPVYEHYPRFCEKHGIPID
jgi:putative sterol carrier protein